MPTKSQRFLEDFDRGRTFLINKPFQFTGRSQEPGQEFDKEQATTRKLRQLYEGRYLRMAAFGDVSRIVPGKPIPAIMPNFPLMPEPALRQWLSDNGRVPHPRATHARLATRAVRRWHELQKQKATAQQEALGGLPVGI